MKSSRKSRRMARTSPSTRSSGALTSSTCRARLPKLSSAVAGMSARSIITRGPRLNSPMPLPGSLAMSAADREQRLTDGDLVADLDVQRRQQLGPDQRTTMLEQRVGIGLSVGQFHRAVEREACLDGAQFGHLGDLPRGVRRPHHGRRLEGLGLLRVAGLGAIGGRSSPSPPATNPSSSKSRRRRRSAIWLRRRTRRARSGSPTAASRWRRRRRRCRRRRTTAGATTSASRERPCAGRTSCADGLQQRVLDDAAIAKHQPGVRHRRQFGVVGHEHQRRAAAAVNRRAADP